MTRRITQEMLDAFDRGWQAADIKDTKVPGARRRAGLRAVFELVDLPLQVPVSSPLITTTFADAQTIHTHLCPRDGEHHWSHPADAACGNVYTRPCPVHEPA